MLVVSDTSPVTALLQIGQSDLLPALFGEVLIPPAVRTELLRFHASLPAYLETRGIQDEQLADRLGQSLDRGESEAIVLAAECKADYLLMDEKRGRAVAGRRGLKVIGVVGVLLLAKKQGHLRSVGELIAELESQAGFFLSEAVKQVALKTAGEAPD